MTGRLIIFDLDGTLYQAHSTATLAVQKAASDFGIPPADKATILSLIGETQENFCCKAAPGLGLDRLPEFIIRVRHWERKLVPERGRLFDGVEAMLYQLKQMGFTLAVCSNGSLEYIGLVLSSCAIDSYFSFIKGKENGKTKSDVMSDLLGELHPEFAVVVGDMKHDFDAARANHIPSIGAAYGYGGEEIALAGYAADKPGDVIGLICKCEIFDKIEKMIARRRAGHPFVIGVNGVDTSGKTQFAAALQAYLGKRGYHTQAIHLDDFHNPRSVRVSGGDEIQSYIDHAFNLELLEAELLQPARSGTPVDRDLQLLDLNTDTFTNRQQYHIDSDTIVILEGVLLYRPPVDGYIDCKVYLDVGFDEVLKRAEQRDVPLYGAGFLERYRTKYLPIQQWYLENCRPKEESDIVIDNTDFNMPRITFSIDE